MGLRDDIQADLSEALNDADDLGDAYIDLEYRDSEDNPISLKGVQTEPALLHIDNEYVKSTSSLFIVLQSVFTGEPDQDGWITIVSTSERFKIAKVGHDPVGATWLIYGNS